MTQPMAGPWDSPKLVTATQGRGAPTTSASRGEPVAVVHEDVVNTYRRWDGYDAGPGDAYWTATQAYWTAVRDAWDAAIAERDGVHVEEEAQTGAVTGPPLMDLAQQIQDGTLSADAAIAQARTVISTATRR